MRAFYPTSFLTTAREIIFLWVARMVMMGLEFAGDVPFRDVYVHPVVQAPDGRRMSKSLGTGIDPLDEIEVHGADALRFGMLAISSTQDVRYSPERVQQGRDLANKLWNASRLVLLNAGDAEPEAADGARSRTAGSSPACRPTIESVTSSIDEYDFSHAALGFYSFFWSEFCDWYLEIVKPRLYDGDEDAAANLLLRARAGAALVHPMMPFVTEEIWGYLPDRDGLLITSDVPASRTRRWSTRRPRRGRGWDRDGRQDSPLARPRRRAGRRGARRARFAADEPEFVARLARLEPDGGDGEALATIGAVEILASDEVDADQVAARIGAERERLQGEIERLERKLGNEGFVAKAPPEVVEAEREKLDGYRAELGELG